MKTAVKIIVTKKTLFALPNMLIAAMVFVMMF